jgi:hypothetical protein
MLMMELGLYLSERCVYLHQSYASDFKLKWANLERNHLLVLLNLPVKIMGNLSFNTIGFTS